MAEAVPLTSEDVKNDVCFTSHLDATFSSNHAAASAELQWQYVIGRSRHAHRRWLGCAPDAHRTLMHVPRCCRRYIGTPSGIMRQYPGVHFEVSGTTCDQFDPRTRPWCAVWPFPVCVLALHVRC